MAMKGTCKVCKHWKRLPISDNFLEDDEIGECNGLQRGNKIDIQIEGSYSGGYISTITTDNDFSCGSYEEIED